MTPRLPVKTHNLLTRKFVLPKTGIVLTVQYLLFVARQLLNNVMYSADFYTIRTLGISWTLYCLAKHPIHQEKCRQEIQSVLNGRNGFEWLPQLLFEYYKLTNTLHRDDMKSLPYTTMCIKEAMRLYPPVPHYFRDLSEDVIIQGHLIPKGNNIF